MRRLASTVVALALVACSTNNSDTTGPTDADAGSTAPNCGRNTAPCAPGGHCDGPPDCASEICRSGTCNAADPSANDTTDDGCGGPHAPACADGRKCVVADDCASTICTGGICQAPSCTDGIKNGAETDTDCGGGNCPACDDGKSCKTGGDCKDAVCDPMANTCSAPTCMDGAQNEGETDVDCGGPCGPCGDGKKCMDSTQCTSLVCKDTGMGLRCQPPACDDAIKNGDESDVDCGGTKCNHCATGQSCNADSDCVGNGCNYKKKCVDAPSCKGQHGGETCGLGEFQPDMADPKIDDNTNHESCCISNEVTGYSDPNQPGKKVYVDKYEITAGRMRQFIESIAAANGGTPDIKSWMAAHRPARWNQGWENVLPGNNAGSQATYVVKDATTDLLYPGQDQYTANNPTQTTWWIRATGATDTAKQQAGQQGTYTVDTGIYYVLGSGTMLPEYYADPNVWSAPNEGELYAVNHALNCYNGHGSYGWSTYWFDAAIVNQYSGGVGKAYSQDVLDEKALNCTPFALFAAFCAWDGGQLMTAEVSDYITGNTTEVVYSAAGTPQTGKLAVGNTGGCVSNTINTFGDGTQGCYNVYYYPGLANDYDDSSKIAPPGRVVADSITGPGGSGPWVDMIGNLEEVVLKRGETQRFDYRGYGVEYASIIHHKNQQTTPRMKGGAFGARCMRFK